MESKKGKIQEEDWLWQLNHRGIAQSITTETLESYDMVVICHGCSRECRAGFNNRRGLVKPYMKSIQSCPKQYKEICLEP